MSIILWIISTVVLAACCIAGGWRLLHYFQLESYQLPGYVRSLRRNAQRALLPCVAMAAAGVALLALGMPAWAAVLVEGAMAALPSWRAVRGKAK